MGTAVAARCGLAAGILIALAGCGDAGSGVSRVENTGTDSVPAPSPNVQPGWRHMAAAPLAARDGHVAVWTGAEMIVWGGAAVGAVPPGEASPADGYSFDPATGTTIAIREERFGDGAAYSPERDSWRVLPPVPVAIGPHGAVAQWTGTEILLFGLTEDGGAAAVAYSPEDDKWRRVVEPPSELSGTAPTSVWTGEEFIVWGGVDHSGPDVPARGAAYKPETDRWRMLRPAPIGTRQWHTAIWTGQEMIVWGGTDLVGGVGVDEARDGAAYDPRTDTWRVLAAAPIAGRYRHDAVWAGEEMLILGGNTFPDVSAPGGAYNPATDAWRVLPVPPILSFRHWAGAVWTGEALLLWGGYNFDTALGDGAAYDPKSDTWTELPAAPVSGRCRHTSIWTGSDFIIWGGTDHCGTYGPRANDGAALRPE